MIQGPNIPGSYAILFFIALDFTFSIRHTHNWASFLLCPNLFILSEDISLFLPSSILDTYWPGRLIWCRIFLPFHTVLGFLRQKYWNGLPFPIPVDYILPKFSLMTCLTWVALPMAQSFIELHKAVINVIILISFLWLLFLFWRL